MGGFLGSIWNSLGNTVNTAGNNLASFFGGGTLGQQNAQTSTAAQQAQAVQQKAQAAGVNTGPLPQATQEALAGVYPGASYTTGQSQPGTYTPPETTTPIGSGKGNGGTGTGAGITPPKSPVPAPTDPNNPYSTANYYAAHPDANPANTPPPTGPLPDNTNTAGSRSAQINAITQNLGTTGAQGSQGDPAEQQLESQIQSEKQALGDAEGRIVGTPEGMFLQTGQKAALMAQETPILQSLTDQLGQYQANRAQSINAETAAGTTATNNVPPTTPLNPAQTLVSPFGGTVASGGGGSTSSLISSLAQQVANKQISAADAQAQLPDQALSGQLNQAILKIDPNFSTTQSNANTGIQGTLPPAAQSATGAITNLGTTLSAMPGMENTSIPVVNNLTRLFSSLTGVGGGSATGLEAARNDAIAAVQNALETANGMNPVDASAKAQSFFPAGLTQAQFQSGVQQFQSLIAAKEGAYGSPGTVSPTAGQGGNTQTINGVTYVLGPNGWEPQ